MERKAVFRKNTDMVGRVIGDETVLLPIYKTSKELNCIYTLNKDASWVWEKIDGKRTLVEIKKRLLEEFDITVEDADKRMQKLLKDLKEIKAVK